MRKIIFGLSLFANLLIIPGVASANDENSQFIERRYLNYFAYISDDYETMKPLIIHENAKKCFLKYNLNDPDSEVIQIVRDFIDITFQLKSTEFREENHDTHMAYLTNKMNEEDFYRMENKYIAKSGGIEQFRLYKNTKACVAGVNPSLGE